VSRSLKSAEDADRAFIAEELEGCDIAAVER
jgi:hypothetical protein